MGQATAARPMLNNSEGSVDGAMLNSSHYNLEASGDGTFITSIFTGSSEANGDGMFEAKDADDGGKHFFSSHLFDLLF